MSRNIGILRLSHRHFRDQRITTHVALIARAFGCTTFTYTGEMDKEMEKSINDIIDRWGGTFEVQHLTSYRSYIKNFKGKIIHFSMYGEDHRKTIADVKKISEDEDLLLIVGGAKVPPEIYELSHFNTAIGFQPHSEIGAIAIFLSDFLGTDILYQSFSGSKISLENNTKANRSIIRQQEIKDDA
jgi:tRNA (cytidine56-2'-O)-methyltransferase